MRETTPSYAARTDMRLLVLITRTEDTFESVLTTLLDAGITGATIVESKGLGSVLRSELPIFTGLTALLPQDSGSRMIVSICSMDSIDTLNRHLDQLPVDARPVGVVLHVQGVIGM
ncbi:MAG: hypothetical protein JNK53_01935 [Phycisphaerae bacterium]|nr:hypothetical protein [Phycisphaerae bacterium]